MRVLLVDHDSEGLETITRAIRGVLELDCVTSKGDALLLLRQNTYDVLIACERCVDGSGLDLLGRTTRTAVPLKRIFAAAPERLVLLGPRLAPFKVQRTINYPIDLEELWLAIAQVTGDGNEETDGTIERVVLDERGIPSAGSVPRSPIPPRPPSPMRAVSPPASAISAGAGNTAAARLAQPTPEPPLRPPPPPRKPPAPAARAPAPPRTASDTGRMRAPAFDSPPKSTSDTGRMRAPAFDSPPKSTSDTGRMRAPAFAPAPPASREPEFPAWEPEMPSDDDLAEVAAQARFGVQQKVVNEVSRRNRQRWLTAVGVAAAVIGVGVYAFVKLYDPNASARKAAIAEQVARMDEQRKVNDGLAVIEIAIEDAITNNQTDIARLELAKLIEQAPDHPRLEFLQKSIERAEELARLSAQGAKPDAGPAAKAAASSAGDSKPAKPRAERNAERVATRTPERTSRPASAASPPARSFGAPIGESPRQSLPLDAPINSAPVTTVRRSEVSFPGRTVESSDQPTQPLPAPPPAMVSSAATGAGSAAVTMPSVAPPEPAPPPVVDVVPAKVVKRVAPVAPASIPAKTKGFVIVRFDIGVNGRVSNLEVVESEPQGVFDDAAQDAVRKWVYEPRKENGVAVESSAKARLVFEAAN